MALVSTLMAKCDPTSLQDWTPLHPFFYLHPRQRPLLLAGVLLSFWTRSELRAQPLYQAVIPDLSEQSPRLRFHLGEIEDGRPKISPILPDTPGPASPWYVAQWQQSSFIRPESLTRDDPSTRDPRLGTAEYAFKAPDGHAHVWVYRHGASWVYELYEKGGMLTDAGGSNLFLSVDSSSSQSTFDHTIIYALDAKIAKARIRYNKPKARASGGVLSQIFTGLGLMFHDPASNKSQFVFMQLPLSLSRPISPNPGYMCSLYNNQPRLLYTPEHRTNDIVLPYLSDYGALHHVKYVLNDYLHRLVANTFPCEGRQIGWTDSAHDLRNWRLTSLYIGLETESSDRRLNAKTSHEQGFVETALQISNLQVTRASN